jgi:hypothetical protein
MKTLFAFLALLALSACASQEAAPTAPGEVPLSRIHMLEMTKPAPGLNEVRITRDARLLTGSDLIEVSVNYVVLAELRAGESISAWLPEGAYTFSVLPNPNPQGFTPRRSIDLALKSGQTRQLRVGGDQFSTRLDVVR